MNAILFDEVSPRDGIQIEKLRVPTEQKIRWLEVFISSGIDFVQVGSFVHPEKVSPRDAASCRPDQGARGTAQPIPRQADRLHRLLQNLPGNAF